MDWKIEAEARERLELLVLSDCKDKPTSSLACYEVKRGGAETRASNDLLLL